MFKLSYVFCFRQNELFVLLLFFISSYVSFSLNGLGFDALVHRIDNKLAIIVIKTFINLRNLYKVLPLYHL